MRRVGTRVAAALLVTLGAVGTALSAPGLVWSLRTSLASGDAPLDSTVAGAPERRWVRLTDAVVRCETVHETSRGRLALATDRAGAELFVVPLPGPCEGARTDGVFLPDRIPAVRLKAIGLDVPADLPVKQGVRLLVPHVSGRVLLVAAAPLTVSLALTLGGLALAWRLRARAPAS